MAETKTYNVTVELTILAETQGQAIGLLEDRLMPKGADHAYNDLYAVMVNETQISIQRGQ